MDEATRSFIGNHASIIGYMRRSGIAADKLSDHVAFFSVYQSSPLQPERPN